MSVQFVYTGQSRQYLKTRVEFNPPSTQTAGLFPSFDSTRHVWRNGKKADKRFTIKDGFELDISLW